MTTASFSGLAEKQFEAPAQQHTASPAMPVTDQITATPTGQAEPCTRRSGQGGRRVNPIQATWTESLRGAPPCAESSAGCRADKRAAVAPQTEMPPCFGEVLLGAWAGVLRVEWCRAGIWREGEEYTWVFQSQLPEPLTSWVPTPEGCVSRIFPLSEQRPVREKVGPARHPTPRPGGTAQNTSVAPAIPTRRPG